MALNLDPLFPCRLVGDVMFKGGCVLLQDIVCGGINVVVPADSHEGDRAKAVRAPIPHDGSRAYGLWRLACGWAEPWLEDLSALSKLQSSPSSMYDI